MKALVIIRLKDGILDPQGEAVRQAVRALDKAKVSNVRIGKIIEIEFDGVDKGSAEASVKAMCDKLLANPVTEDYQIVDIS
ncbi:MAG: phosphoribosylformylglycinamidine synthase subunit PurS [Nitrospinota bacterium]|nr:phosphoribosylformylglycinamidine synthase subunit PurS [Nitrospinota bacterium]MDH5679697.1 phosphoribosylformylglycinamidine synthase subunit PurS [Nitrospinota bacterium]MDH5756453.1 phosphoribosylformylglycinamidine synthase subunit PurS [Nitrospinota bacterium]